jgi:hypothetical protein
MCYAIYGALIVLFALFCDSLLEPLALSVANGEGGWVFVAQGWEMVSELWPLLLLAAVVSSFLSYLVMGRVNRRGKV